MRIPSLVWLPICIAVVYVGMKGLLCCIYDIAIWAQGSEEKQPELQSESAVMSRSSQIKTIVFWCSILALGYMAFHLARNVL